MLKKVSFNFRGKEISVNSKKCTGLHKFFGLMFKREEDADSLIFEFEKPVNLRIHSLFVFFPFVAVWLDEKNKVIEARRIRPFIFSIKARKPYKRLLEIPLNKKYREKAKLLFSRR